MADAPEQAPKDLIGFLDFYLVKKAPFQIPDAGREFLVKFGPWITLVLMVITLPFLLLVLGVGTVISPFAGVGYATSFGLTAILFIAQFVLRAIALPGLFARKMSGWNLLFYSMLVGFVASLTAYNVIGAILGLIIGLYILFQVRSKYS
jgi:hypothetical protein